MACPSTCCRYRRMALWMTRAVCRTLRYDTGDRELNAATAAQVGSPCVPRANRNACTMPWRRRMARARPVCCLGTNAMHLRKRLRQGWGRSRSPASTPWQMRPMVRWTSHPWWRWATNHWGMYPYNLSTTCNGTLNTSWRQVLNDSQSQAGPASAPSSTQHTSMTAARVSSAMAQMETRVTPRRTKYDMSSASSGLPAPPGKKFAALTRLACKMAWGFHAWS